MSDDVSKRTWVTRVLGCKFPGSDAAPKQTGVLAALLRWRQAMTEANATLASFGKTLLANAEVAADPRVKFVAASVAELPKLLPPTGRKVEAVIAAAAKSPNGSDTVLKAVAAYRQSLAVAAQLAKLEAFAQTSMKTPLGVTAKLGAAMDEIETTVRKAA